MRRLDLSSQLPRGRGQTPQDQIGQCRETVLIVPGIRVGHFEDGQRSRRRPVLRSTTHTTEWVVAAATDGPRLVAQKASQRIYRPRQCEPDGPRRFGNCRSVENPTKIPGPPSKTSNPTRAERVLLSGALESVTAALCRRLSAGTGSTPDRLEPTSVLPVLPLHLAAKSLAKAGSPNLVGVDACGRPATHATARGPHRCGRARTASKPRTMHPGRETEPDRNDMNTASSDPWRCQSVAPVGFVRSLLRSAATTISPVSCLTTPLPRDRLSRCFAGGCPWRFWARFRVWPWAIRIGGRERSRTAPAIGRAASIARTPSLDVYDRSYLIGRDCGHTTSPKPPWTTAMRKRRTSGRAAGGICSDPDDRGRRWLVARSLRPADGAPPCIGMDGMMQCHVVPSSARSLVRDACRRFGPSLARRSGLTTAVSSVRSPTPSHPHSDPPGQAFGHAR